MTVGLPGATKQLEVAVADADPDPWGAQQTLSVVGTRQPRIDARPKVTGAAKYTADISLSGMLHGRILRCPHPAAKIVKVDASKVRAHPAVRAVLTFEGAIARYQGEEVAALAATTPEAADEALALFAVTYQPRPFVTDLEKARAPEAPPVYDDAKKPSPNVRQGNVRSRGDALKAFAGAELQAEGTFRTQVQTHCCLEPHGVVVQWEGEDLTIWASTQGTFAVRDGMAEGLEIPKSRVRVITDYMGGGFGSKYSAGPFALIAARLAKQAKAPVKMMLTRKDEHLVTGNRPDAVMSLKVGATRAGSLEAVALTSYGTPGVGSGAGVSGPMRATYRVRHLRTEESDILTNTGPAAPFRAPGHPQGSFAFEQAIDMIAEQAGSDPIAYRKLIDIHPIRLAQYDVGAKEIGWSRRAAMKAANAKGSIKRGLGMASALWYNSGGPGATVHVRVSKDGAVEVMNGAQDIGTGTRTAIGMVAAEELGLPLDQVTVRLGRTDWPEGPGSGGSTTVPTLMPAVRAAAFDARTKLAAIAAKVFGVEGSKISVKPPGLFYVTSDPSRTLTFKQVAARIPGELLTAQGSRAADYEGFDDRIAGVQFAEVTVDTGTGKIKVEKVVAVHDCGRVINPLTAESQIGGGVVQGLSYALFEDRLLDPVTGRMLNANLEQYKIAGPLDIPEIVAIAFSVPVGFNSIGALGLGEPPVIPTAAAIANAVHHATGVRMLQLPMTPSRVLAALRSGHA